MHKKRLERTVIERLDRELLEKHSNWKANKATQKLKNIRKFLGSEARDHHEHVAEIRERKKELDRDHWRSLRALDVELSKRDEKVSERVKRQIELKLEAVHEQAKRFNKKIGEVIEFHKRR